MKKIVLSAVLLTFVLGLSNQVFGETKIGVVDVPMVVSKSSQVQALRKEQKAKIQELEKWLKTAQADINKQKTEEGKEKLAAKYQADFNKKKETIATNYQKKLEAADKSITNKMTTEAQKAGYDIVISKEVVLYGGENITDLIIKAVK